MILVLGEPVEIDTVRWMYWALVEEGKLKQEIADLLHSRLDRRNRPIDEQMAVADRALPVQNAILVTRALTDCCCNRLVIFKRAQAEPPHQPLWP